MLNKAPSLNEFRIITCLALSTMFILTVGCTNFSGSTDNPQDARNHLTFEELMAEKPPGMVDNKYYMPIKPSDQAPHKLSGTISFSETLMNHQVSK